MFLLRFILFTDKGNFWAPIIQKCSPAEKIDSSFREYSTHPVKFTSKFSLLNVYAVDLENQQIVKPSDAHFPSEIGEGETISFQFRFRQCLR